MSVDYVPLLKVCLRVAKCSATVTKLLLALWLKTFTENNLIRSGAIVITIVSTRPIIIIIAMIIIVF